MLFKEQVIITVFKNGTDAFMIFQQLTEENRFKMTFQLPISAW